MITAGAWEDTLDSELGPTDEAMVIACADLVGRAGAKHFEIGYLDDDVPADQARWWAKAQYRGARLQADEHASPSEAAHALAVRILTGAACKCGSPVSLTPEQEGCHWRLTQPEGPQSARWESGCDAPAIDIEAGERGDVAAMHQRMQERAPAMNREQRRAFERAQRRGQV